MQNDKNFAMQVDLIRRGAGEAARFPFAGSHMVDVCLSVEKAGIPEVYRLPDTAREYSIISDKERLTVKLASRLGNPKVPPAPPMWPLLGILLLSWRETISLERVRRHAAKLRLEQDVERGLAIVAFLFPELKSWSAQGPSRLPLWERTLAVPLAARKLVFAEALQKKATNPDGGPEGNSNGGRHEIPVNWRVTGGSRRGASHHHADLPNQDAILYYTSQDKRSSGMALADGHGTELYFRSGTGSRLAVETALAVLRRFAERTRPEQCRAASTQLGVEVAGGWLHAVTQDLERNPITAEEWKRLVAMAGWQGKKVVENRPEVAYGSTVLGVLATQSYVLTLQIGDGDILFVDTQGYTRRALSRHTKYSGKRDPASLCQSAAAERIFVQIEDTAENFPALILAATDGYSEGFDTDEAFLGVGEEYLRMVQSKGFDEVEKRLKGFLGEAKYDGDGDDLTIGVVARS